MHLLYYRLRSFEKALFHLFGKVTFCLTSRYLISHNTEEVTKSGSLLPLEKNSLLSKTGDQRCNRKCYLLGYCAFEMWFYVESP